MTTGQIWLNKWATMNNVRREFDLYPGMCKWLESYLKNKHKKTTSNIIVIDCHSQTLDRILQKHNVLKYFPKTVGLKIEIDVLGMVIGEKSAKLYFIEAKKTKLTLPDLGQLLMYCKLCDPEEAFLLSSSGLGSLKKVLIALAREDLLDFGSGIKIKKIKVAKWDVLKNTIENSSSVPKL